MVLNVDDMGDARPDAQLRNGDTIVWLCFGTTAY